MKEHFGRVIREIVPVYLQAVRLGMPPEGGQQALVVEVAAFGGVEVGLEFIPNPRWRAGYPP